MDEHDITEEYGYSGYVEFSVVCKMHDDYERMRGIMNETIRLNEGVFLWI